jgi:ribosome-binding factor A
MTSRKLEHLNERVRHKLGTILERESNDPRFRHVTVTGVRLSKDLSHARVTFTTHDALVPPALRARQKPSAPGQRPTAPRESKGTAPKGPKGATPKGSHSATPKGSNSAAPKGPKGTAPGRKSESAAPPGLKSTAAGDIPSLTEALNRAAGFFAHAVARSLETRVSPRLTFVYDPSIDYLQDMENVLKPLRASGEMGDPDRPTGADAAGQPDALASHALEDADAGDEAAGPAQAHPANADSAEAHSARADGGDAADGDGTDPDSAPAKSSGSAARHKEAP